MNKFLSLRLGVCPDTGVDARRYDVFTVYSHGLDCIQLRTRRHGSRFSAGYYVSVKDEAVPARELFPSSASGLFASEREARLYAMGEILELGLPLSPHMREALKATISDLCQRPLFE